MLLPFKDIRAYLKTEGFLDRLEPLTDSDDNPFWVAVLEFCKAKRAAGELAFDPFDGAGQEIRDRRVDAVEQHMLYELGMYSGGFDGVIGPAHRAAYDMWQTFRKNGGDLFFGENVKDDPPKPPGNLGAILEELKGYRQNWPYYKNANLTAFYGPRATGIIRVTMPYKKQIDWAPHTWISTTSIHKKCAESWIAVQEAHKQHYGEDGLRDLNLHRWGGIFNNRKVRGSSSTWSTHSWGCAEDIWPAENQFRWRAPQAKLHASEYDAYWDMFEAAGWHVMGRELGYDWMHVQAAHW